MKGEPIVDRIARGKGGGLTKSLELFALAPPPTPRLSSMLSSKRIGEMGDPGAKRGRVEEWMGAFDGSRTPLDRAMDFLDSRR